MDEGTKWMVLDMEVGTKWMVLDMELGTKWMNVQTFSYIGYFIVVQVGDILQILPEYINLNIPD